MNLWCKDTTVCAINSTFSVDFYTFYWANVCTVCTIRLQFILKMFHCMTTPSGIIVHETRKYLWRDQLDKDMDEKEIEELE